MMKISAEMQHFIDFLGNVMSKALVVFSGGQDSTTVLGYARWQGFDCHAIAFNYGQKHAVELQQAQKIADKLGVPLTIVDVREFGKLVGSKSALLHSGQEVGEKSLLADNLPASFVPNRNAMFLTMAHGFAQVIGADTVFTGVCETDFSGYPDCREKFIKSLQASLNLGYQTDISIITPLMHINKAETFKMAERVGVLDLVLDESHTCYNGVRGIPEYHQAIAGAAHRWAWGHGCGQCPACELRAKGWREYQEMVRIY